MCYLCEFADSWGYVRYELTAVAGLSSREVVFNVFFMLRPKSIMVVQNQQLKVCCIFLVDHPHYPLFCFVCFLLKVYSVAIEAGATTINVPDTVGYTTPKEFMGLMHHLRGTVRYASDWRRNGRSRR